MHRRCCLRRALDLVFRGGVTRMAVREDDPLDAQTVELGQNFRRVIAGVDHHRLFGVSAGHDIAVGVLLADVDLLDGETSHESRLGAQPPPSPPRKRGREMLPEVDNL